MREPQNDKELIEYCKWFLDWKDLSPTAPAAVIARKLLEKLGAK